MNIQDILFNWCCYDTDIDDPRAGKKMKIGNVTQIQKSDGTNRTRCQTFDCGFRVNNELLDFKYWNNVIYEDIDYKKYIMTHNHYVDPVYVQNVITQYLMQNYRTVFMMSELSRSETSFHFYFCFDVERNRANRERYKAICDAIILNAFIVKGFEEIIRYDGVFDDCTDSPVQMVYMTKNNLLINHSCTGNTNMLHLDGLNIRWTNDGSVEPVSIRRDDYEITFEKNDDVHEHEYIAHHTRWLLFDGLSRLYRGDELFREWCRCAEMIPCANGHDTDFYMNEPYKNHWDEKLEGDEYIDVDLLHSFGYDVTFTKHTDKFTINDNFIKVFI